MDTKPELRLKLHQGLSPLLTGASLCIKKRLQVPAVVLLYSLIDTLGWLDADGPATGHTFIAWAKRYVISDSGLTCSAEDLYSARCGVLHTLSPNSSLIDQGKAQPVYYAWGTGVPSDLERLGKHIAGRPPAAVIHVELLRDAIGDGLFKFIEDVVNSSPDKVESVERKLGQVFSPMPANVVAEALDILGEQGQDGWSPVDATPPRS